MHSAKKSGGSGSGRNSVRRGAHVTRAQMRAMEARAAAVVVSDPLATEEAGSEEPAELQPIRSSRVAANRRRSAAVKIYSIPRALEYTYIRADLRRLIITAASLLVIMIVLLVVLD
jgi:hypothetical protein